MKIYQKWDEFSGMLINYDDNANDVINADKTTDEELNKKLKEIDPENPTEEDVKTIVSATESKNDRIGTVLKAEELVIIDYLDATPYEDGTLLDFFSNDESVFAGDGIRSLYPIAASLSAGQIACLDFYSLKDLFSMALTDEDGYHTLDIKEMTTASFYQDVDREIYEPGGLAPNGGGAIYVDDAPADHQAILFESCIFCGNRAGRDGGAFFVCDDGVALSNTEITKNSAKKRGGAVFVDARYGITVRGLVTIDNNTCDDNKSMANLTLEDGTIDEAKIMNAGLYKGSHIAIGTTATSGKT